MVAVKICGLSTPQTVAHAVAHGARWVGFVTYPPSPRTVSPHHLAGLARQAPEGSRVAVLVDADDALIDAVAPHVDCLQLHGKESPSRAAELRARTGRAVWKALPVAEAVDVERASLYVPHVDALLFDARPRPDARLPGGNGAAFDWALMRGRSIARPWLLSGGLTGASLAAALAQSGACSVDVSSGVETQPGVKSAAKVAAFLREARRLSQKDAPGAR
ncbi:MAG: phosphoribosylanthranilate isomerase [Rhodothalassiaceae bacterium]